MRLLKNADLNQTIQNNFNFTFYIPTDDLYFFEITAFAHSWWQNLKSFKSFFSDDDLTLAIDNNITFPKLNKKKGLFDGEVAWNGNNLKGLSKTNIILINLIKGNHTLNFIANQNPILESINIFQIENSNQITYTPQTNNPAQNGDRRQWLNLILANLPLNTLTIKSTAKKQKTDDTDIKLIIDGQIQTNTTPKSHKDWYWCGRVLNGQEKGFSKTLNLAKGLHYIELWADGEADVGEIGLNIFKDDKKEEIKRSVIKKYSNKGPDGTRDYNRYDQMIEEIVAKWNKEFLNDKYPVEIPLDPNLVKAIIYQESKVGYFAGGEIDVMQVGDPRDPALKTLNNKSVEYWMRDGKEIELNYNGKANADTIYNSIYWGVRWLYHKAQYTESGKRHWKDWREAVYRYGPITEKYIDEVWSVYINGVDKENVVSPIKLWSVFFLIPFLIGWPSLNYTYIIEREANDQIYSIKKQVLINENKKTSVELEGVEVKLNQKDPALFFSILEWRKDWWEKLKVGRIKEGNIVWINILEPPSEKYILSASFLNLKGFNNPILEVYGKTHMGYGSLYLYEIKDNEVKLLLETPAVDSHNDNIWSPDNYKKYGFSICGEVFTSGQLFSGYQDLNNDKIDDVILSGQKEILCDKMNDSKDNKNDFDFSEVKVASTDIKKIFLWDNKMERYFEK